LKQQTYINLWSWDYSWTGWFWEHRRQLLVCRNRPKQDKPNFSKK